MSNLLYVKPAFRPTILAAMTSKRRRRAPHFTAEMETTRLKKTTMFTLCPGDTTTKSLAVKRPCMRPKRPVLTSTSEHHKASLPTNMTTTYPFWLKMKSLEAIRISNNQLSRLSKTVVEAPTTLNIEVAITRLAHDQLAVLVVSMVYKASTTLCHASV